MIIVREFIKIDEDQITNFVDEIRSYDGNFEGLENISRIENFEDFLKTLEKNKHKELIKKSNREKQWSS